MKCYLYRVPGAGACAGQVLTDFAIALTGAKLFEDVDGRSVSGHTWFDIYFAHRWMLPPAREYHLGYVCMGHYLAAKRRVSMGEWWDGLLAEMEAVMLPEKSGWRNRARLPVRRVRLCVPVQAWRGHVMRDCLAELEEALRRTYRDT